MASPIHVLHIARWYPWQRDAMLGLFLQRQVDALPAYIKNTVLFVWPDEEVRSVEREVLLSENGTKEIRIIYPKRRNSLSNAFLWWYLARAEAKRLFRERPFDLVHAHMLTRTAMLALSLRRSYDIPYVVSEHWSRYFPEASGYRHPLKLRAARKTLARSAALICVSEALKSAMQSHELKHSNTLIVPNVVDTDLFAPSEQVRSERNVDALNLIHLSCFDDGAKNISGLLHGFAAARTTITDMHLVLYGDGPDRNAMIQLAHSLGLGHSVRFPGEIAVHQVAKALNEADFLVQTSHYETFSVAVVEAWACGVPVVSTPVGVFGQFAHEPLGITIPDASPESIASALIRLPALKKSFDPVKLRNFAIAHFCKEHVGALLTSIYQRTIPHELTT